MNYERNQMDFHRGTFRANGDVIDIAPLATDGFFIRIDCFGDDVERIIAIDKMTGEVKQ